MRPSVILIATILALSATDGVGLGELSCGNSEVLTTVIPKALDSLLDEYDIVEGQLTFPNFAQPDGRYGLINFPGDKVNPPVLCAIARKVPTPYGPELCDFTTVMGPRDGVVGALCTPPAVRYFSFRSYAAFRFKPQPWLPGAELGDPANHLLINTTAADPEDRFNKLAMFVSTGDAHTARRAQGAFVDAGFPANATNLDIIASDKTHFRDMSKPWFLDLSDAIVWYFRVSSVVDREHIEAYLKSSFPFYLLRAKQPAPREPLTRPPLRPRGTGEGENPLLQPLLQLAGAVVTDMEARGAVLHAHIPTHHVIPDTDRCLTDPTYAPIANDKFLEAWNMSGFATCGFFTRDALYTFISDEGVDYRDLYFPKNRSYVLLGVNQVAAGKAAYSNIFMTAVAAPQQPGHTVNYSGPALAGTATRYLPDVPEGDQLFAVELSRDCGDRQPPACTTVTEKTFNFTEWVFVVERKYLQNVTRIGPDAKEVLTPMILAFETPERAMGEQDEALLAEE